ncbi:hypothetical protein LJY25_14155 [Hymenobacter sp. BT175]|uniref:hypothetical protein n=1 Tax=Hymenobacter translucens TaxID=2886507 RepID=UPI001D0EBEDE|nr:hypothetical protein [Hymenobacter translucens]MCC2547596.1 hypothetical protein [Hymenobacter translucens]
MLLSTLLTGLTLLASPQTPPDSTVAPRYQLYAGAQAYSFRFAGPGQQEGENQWLTMRGPLLMVGYQPCRWYALEASFGWRPGQGPTTTRMVNGGESRSYERHQSWMVPLLSRVRFVPVRRWGVEGVVGLTALHSKIEYYDAFTPAGQPQRPFYMGGSTEANDLPLTLGAAVTYSPTPRWTLVGEGRLNWSWLGTLVGQAFFGQAYYAPQPGVSLGLRYNFLARRR